MLVLDKASHVEYRFDFACFGNNPVSNIIRIAGRLIRITHLIFLYLLPDIPFRTIHILRMNHVPETPLCKLQKVVIVPALIELYQMIISK